MDNETRSRANTCRVCGSSESTPSIEKNGALYVVCSGCGVCYLNPIPNEAQTLKVYTNDYIHIQRPGLNHHKHYQPEHYETFRHIHNLNFRDIGYDLAQQREPLEVLDVGCSIGLFLKYLSEFPNVRAQGVDISPDLAGIAKERGFSVSVGSIFDVVGSFDLITFWDVLEHLFWPLETIQRAGALLNPGGGLILHTPCRGIISDAYGADWCHYWPPEHVFLFNQSSLFSLLAQSGFMVKRWVRFGSGAQRGSLPDSYKNAFDKIAKAAGIGDSIVVYAVKQ